jgi:gamma-glutamyltranspeptidase/glutathione hydrolase
LPDVVQYEPGAFDVDMIKALTARGHQLTPLDATYGNMQAIYWDRKTGQVTATSDPRGAGDARVGLFR